MTYYRMISVDHCEKYIQQLQTHVTARTKQTVPVNTTYIKTN